MPNTWDKGEYQEAKKFVNLDQKVKDKMKDNHYQKWKSLCELADKVFKQSAFYNGEDGAEHPFVSGVFIGERP